MTSDASTNKPLYILLCGVLLMHLGNFMVVPLLPIFLSLEKQLSAASIGLVLAVMPFFFQAGSLLGGWLADRVGRRFVISLGALIQAAALIGYVYGEQLWMLVVVSAFSGLGIGLNAPATKAAIAALSTGAARSTQAFSLRGIAANIGIAAAGLFTYFVIGGPSPLIFYTASALFVLLALISRFMLPAGCGAEPCRNTPVTAYLQVFHNRAFVGFATVSFVIWGLYTQLSLSLPIRGEHLLANPGAVSLIWTINSVTVIALQTWMTRRVIVKHHPLHVLAVGALFFGGGLGLLGFVQGFAGLIICGIIFIMGEMLVMPTIDSTVSRLGAVRTIGVYFGSANLIAGLGESSGKYAGGHLLEVGQNTPYPWLVYIAVAVVTSITLVLLRQWQPLHQMLTVDRSIAGEETAEDAGREGESKVRGDFPSLRKKGAK